MTIIPNFADIKTKAVDTLKKPVVITIIVLSVLLIVSVSINIYLIRSSESDAADIKRMRDKEAVLFKQNAALEKVNKDIQSDKDARTVEIDSLKKVINGYDKGKTGRANTTAVAVKKSNNLGAHESLDNFLRWAEN